jgi:hypothetical protein
VTRLNVSVEFFDISLSQGDISAEPELECRGFEPELSDLDPDPGSRSCRRSSGVPGGCRRVDSGCDFTRDLSSSPSLQGSAEDGGVDSAMERDGLEGEGEEDGDDDEAGVAASELGRRGEGDALYLCR